MLNAAALRVSVLLLAGVTVALRGAHTTTGWAVCGPQARSYAIGGCYGAEGFLLHVAASHANIPFKLTVYQHLLCISTYYAPATTL